MIKPEEIVIRKSQADVMTQVIMLHSQIIDLRRDGRIITQEQTQLREYLRKI